ncbi:MULTISPECIES: hypothetical protein [unclassified Burkholderia]|uniref:hypothetical protein n=1 Tax=unclassified Burkholderia TaxID=2613784 RepID=UPI000F56EBBC|nr:MULTISPECIES: hypothetical protein [unclassified Burkholderia]
MRISLRHILSGTHCSRDSIAICEMAATTDSGRIGCNEKRERRHIRQQLSGDLQANVNVVGLRRNFHEIASIKDFIQRSALTNRF